MKNILLGWWFMVVLVACNAVEQPAVETGFLGINLKDTYKVVSRAVPSIQEAPKHVSAKRGEGFKEYYSTSSPAFNILGVNFNPSIFCVFNPSEELVSLRVILVTEVAKTAFNKEKICKLLNSKIPDVEALSKKEGMQEQVDNDVVKKITIDMESLDFPIIEYEVKYLP